MPNNNLQESLSHAREAYQESLNETIEAFKSLITSPTEELKNWKRYGSEASCRLCAVRRVTISLWGGCTVCPLRGCTDPEPAKSRGCLCGALDDQDLPDIELSARLHLRWLLKAAVKNGYKVKEETLADPIRNLQNELNLYSNPGGNSHSREDTLIPKRRRRKE